MNQIIKQVNTIICFKNTKKSRACVLRILNLQFVYMNQIIKQVNAICFKSACCYNHGTCLHLCTIHEPTNQASESNFF